MGNVKFMRPEEVLEAARAEEVLRSRQLLVAAQQYYDGEITEDEFTGYVCRYGYACLERRLLRHEATALTAVTNAI